MLKKNKKLFICLLVMVLSVISIIVIFITAKNNFDSSLTNDVSYGYRVMHEKALLGVAQIIIMILMSLAFSISLIYLIFTKGGKLNNKEAFINSDKVTIAILETVVLTLSLTSINTLIANNIENSEQPSKNININDFHSRGGSDMDKEFTNT